MLEETGRARACYFRASFYDVCWFEARPTEVHFAAFTPGRVWLEDLDSRKRRPEVIPKALHPLSVEEFDQNRPPRSKDAPSPVPPCYVRQRNPEIGNHIGNKIRREVRTFKQLVDSKGRDAALTMVPPSHPATDQGLECKTGPT